MSIRAVEVARAIDAPAYAAEVRCGTTQAMSYAMCRNAASTQPGRVHSDQPIGVVAAVSAFNSSTESDRSSGGACGRRRLPGSSETRRGDAAVVFSPVALLAGEAGPPACLTWPSARQQDRRRRSRLASRSPVWAISAFVGSAAVGKHLRSPACDQAARCAFEHGGVAPVIVVGDADLEMALPTNNERRLFHHAGQTCVSVHRVFAHRSIVRRWSTSLAERASASGSARSDDARTKSGR